jgi:CheY-like chemotaxis protein
MRKALIAEDNPVNRELLRELLEGRGWEVEEACDGEAALGMLECTRPDILLLDLGMPKLDGYGVLSKIRENAQLADLPVLAVTAFAMRGDREKVLDAGFDGYLSKPINAISLAEELERLLGRPGARRAVSAQAANRLSDGKAGPENPRSDG